jgi:hypothetical protein
VLAKVIRFMHLRETSALGRQHARPLDLGHRKLRRDIKDRYGIGVAVELDQRAVRIDR